MWPEHDDSEESDDRMNIDPQQDRYSVSSEGSRKRQASPSFDDCDDYPSHHSNPYASSSKKPKHDHSSPRASPGRSTLDNAPPKKRRSYAKEVMRQCSRSPENSPPSVGYPRPNSVLPGEEDSYEKQFLQAVDTCLQKDRMAWSELFKAKSGDERLYDIVKQYEFLHRLCATWVGELVPGYDTPIEEVGCVLC